MVGVNGVVQILVLISITNGFQILAHPYKSSQDIAISIKKNVVPQPNIAIGPKIDLIKRKANPGKSQTDNELDSFISKLDDDKLSKREARVIIGALDRQSCFAKVLCGLGSKTPSKNTNLLNDYAYLLGDLMVNSEEDTGPKANGSSSLLAEILDSVASSKEDEEDTQSDEEDNNNYLRLLPFHRPLRSQKTRIVIRPKIWMRRLGKQLEGRQCRQLGNLNKCPYDDKALGDIVTKLKGILRGDDLLNTITMTALGGSQAVGSIQRPSAVNSQGKMNVVINLQQNLTMPHSAGFAAVPFGSFYGQNASSSVKTNESSSFQPFYIVPLPTETPATAETSTTPTEATPEADPLEKLMGFLYNVGYATNKTNSKETSSLSPIFPAAAPSPTTLVTEEEDSDEQDDTSVDVSAEEKLREDIQFVKVKSSGRTGRFHVGGDEQKLLPQPHPVMTFHEPESLLVRALRLFATMFRGGPMLARRTASIWQN